MYKLIFFPSDCMKINWLFDMKIKRDTVYLLDRCSHISVRDKLFRELYNEL